MQIGACRRARPRWKMDGRAWIESMPAACCCAAEVTARDESPGSRASHRPSIVDRVLCSKISSFMSFFIVFSFFLFSMMCDIRPQCADNQPVKGPSEIGSLFSNLSSRPLTAIEDLLCPACRCRSGSASWACLKPRRKKAAVLDPPTPSRSCHSTISLSAHRAAPPRRFSVAVLRDDFVCFAVRSIEAAAASLSRH